MKSAWRDRPLDLIVAGGAYSGDSLARLSVLRGIKEVGHAGNIGLSFHDREVGLTIARSGLADIQFIRYNAGHDGAERDLFPFMDQAMDFETLRI